MTLLLLRFKTPCKHCNLQCCGSLFISRPWRCCCSGVKVFTGADKIETCYNSNPKVYAAEYHVTTVLVPATGLAIVFRPICPSDSGTIFAQHVIFRWSHCQRHGCTAGDFQGVIGEGSASKSGKVSSGVIPFCRFVSNLRTSIANAHITELRTLVVQH